MGTVLPKSITGAFSSNSRLNVREDKRNCKSVIEIFWDKVFIVGNMVKKKENVICRKRCTFDMQFHLIVVQSFQKSGRKIMEIATANCYKNGFD